MARLPKISSSGRLQPGFRAQGLRVQGLKHARPSNVRASSSKGLGGLLRAPCFDATVSFLKVVHTVLLERPQAQQAETFNRQAQVG